MGQAKNGQNDDIDSGYSHGDLIQERPTAKSKGRDVTEVLVLSSKRGATRA